MQVSGKVIFCDIYKGISKAGREWRKKTFVVEYMEGTKVKQVAFDMCGDDKIKDYPVECGQNVTVEFEVGSTEYNGRWFTTAHAQRVTLLDTPNSSPIPTPTPWDVTSSTDDLPF